MFKWVSREPYLGARVDAAIVGAGAQLHRRAGGVQRAQEVAEQGLRGQVVLRRKCLRTESCRDSLNDAGSAADTCFNLHPRMYADMRKFSQ